MQPIMAVRKVKVHCCSYHTDTTGMYQCSSWEKEAQWLVCLTKKAASGCRRHVQEEWPKRWVRRSGGDVSFLVG
jgi:hypothetical protein